MWMGKWPRKKSKEICMVSPDYDHPSGWEAWKGLLGQRIYKLTP